jgi:hypothetical protein
MDIEQAAAMQGGQTAFELNGTGTSDGNVQPGGPVGEPEDEPPPLEARRPGRKRVAGKIAGHKLFVDMRITG